MALGGLDGGVLVRHDVMDEQSKSIVNAVWMRRLRRVGVLAGRKTPKFWAAFRCE
jgi:hypothetical protein